MVGRVVARAARPVGCTTGIVRGEYPLDYVEEGVLVLRRIHVVFTLRGVEADKVAPAQRAHEVFKPKCPVYRSIHRAIDITTELGLLGATGS